MAKLEEGEVIFLPFPFSDLSQKKKRPAVVLKKLRGDDVILCPITKVKPKEGEEPYIALTDDNFENGSLNINPSYARTSHFFTADSNITLFKVGKLKEDIFAVLRKQASSLF